MNTSEMKQLGKNPNQDQNFGFFTLLGTKFTSTYQQIEKYSRYQNYSRNYATLIKYYQDPQSTNPEYQALALRIQEAYQIIKNEQNRNEYLHNLMIRSYLSQSIEMTIGSTSKKEVDKLFPFFIYEVIKEGTSEVFTKLL